MFPDGTRFYPDKQNGEYGFNTDVQRGADTFRPFIDKDLKTLSVSIPDERWTQVTLPTPAKVFVAIININSTYGGALLHIPSHGVIMNTSSGYGTNISYVSEQVVNCYICHGNSAVIYYV